MSCLLAAIRLSKLDLLIFERTKAHPLNGFFRKIDYEGVFALPLDKAVEHFQLNENRNVLFLRHILTFSAMYAILLSIEKLDGYVCRYCVL